VTVTLPEKRYARNNGLHVAYQLVGNGPVDVVLLTQWFSNIDSQWDVPPLASWPVSGGREVDTVGDGFLAVFDGSGRAVRCASAAVRSVQSLGIEIRAGVHTGEVDLVAGSSLQFEDRGSRELKGVPDPWRVLALIDG
jgi:hypothetical protein